MDNISALKEIISKLSSKSIPVENMREDSDIFKDFSFDSIKTIQLIVEIEKKFNIEFDDDYLFDINKISRLKDINSYIDAKLSLQINRFV